jgi:hypothetical protein
MLQDKTCKYSSGHAAHDSDLAGEPNRTEGNACSWTPQPVISIQAVTIDRSANNRAQRRVVFSLRCLNGTVLTPNELIHKREKKTPNEISADRRDMNLRPL